MTNAANRIAVILPALNEEESVAKVIEEIPVEVLERNGYKVQVIVVDNNSTDKTRVLAEQAGATVLFEPLRGKGRAIQTAFNTLYADYVFMLDADYTYPAGHIVEMLEVLRHKDVVIGSRLTGRREKGSITRLNVVGNILLSFLATLLYGKHASDLCTGYWGFKGKVIKNINLHNVSGFELETRLFIEIVKRGYTFSEIPINYRCRAGGCAKLNPLRDGLGIAFSLVRNRFKS